MLGGAGSAAAHGGDTTLIHGCVSSGGGGLKIIEANGVCAKSEQPLDWAANGGGTTYSAGAGLSLSTGNVFSVTGAPWSGLNGVPAGFADGDDDDGAAAISQMSGSLAANDALPNESSDLVSFAKLKDLIDGAGDGRITSGFIRDRSLEGRDIAAGTITATNLAGNYETGIAGAVTSDKIRDGTVEARDLAPGVADRIVHSVLVDPQSAPAQTRITVNVPLAGVDPLDVVTVSPPSGLEEQLLFVGSDVLVPDVLTIYLYNASATGIDGVQNTWTVRQIRMDR